MSDKNGTHERVAPKNLMALEELLASRMPQLYHAAARVLQNPQDSEDALQDGLLSAFIHLNQFQGRSRLSTWLHSIVKNAAHMQLRKRSRSHTTSITDDTADEDGRRADEVLVDSRPSPEEECAREERSRMLIERLGYLSPNYRSVVQVCMIEGLLRREAAEKLGVSMATVKSRLHRACKLLVKHA